MNLLDSENLWQLFNPNLRLTLRRFGNGEIYSLDLHDLDLDQWMDVIEPMSVV